MKVAMYYRNSDVRVETMPIPEVRPGDILVKVMASGICGSDLLEWYRIKRAPLVLGHEIAGEVLETGAGVECLKKGDRIYATHHVPCGQCRYCLRGSETACETFHGTNNFFPGGFAEYVRVSGRSVQAGTLVLPEEVSYEEGSFIEPLGTVLRCVRVAGLEPGESLLVVGAGIAGLLMIKAAVALGVGTIIAVDVSRYRLEAARRYGADIIVEAGQDVPASIRSACGGRLADKVIVCTGALSAAYQALEAVDRGGTVVFFAVPRPGEMVSVDFNPFWRNDVTIRTCYGAAPLDALRALELLRHKRVTVSDMVTHRFSLDRIQEAFDIAGSPERCLKVIVQPHHGAQG